MKVLAQQGYGYRLVALDEPTDELFDITPGVVVNMRRGTVSEPANIHSILSRGYWSPFEGDPAPVLALVSSAQVRGLTAATYTESKHRRWPRGTPVQGPKGGGRFAPKQEGIEPAEEPQEEVAEHPFVSNYAAIKSAGLDTQGFYLDESGRYPRSRARLHDALVALQLEKAVAPQGEPETLFLAGGPGAGKSSIRPMVSPPSDAVVVNPDDIKLALPEWEEGLAAGDPMLASLVHEESSDLAARVLRESNEAGFNVIVDGTGNAEGPGEAYPEGKFVGKVRDAQRLGRRTRVVLVDIPTEEAVRRAVARATDPDSPEYGRMVPEEVIRSTHKSVTQRHLEWRDMLEDWEVWANDDPEQGGRRLIARRVNGQPYEILDPDRYTQLERKANE